MKTKITFIGAGNMAEAIISPIKDKYEITCNDTSAGRLEDMRQKYAVCTETDLQKAAAEAEIIILAVKPQVIAGVLGKLKPVLPKNAFIISIAAGITTRYIENTLGENASVVRAMPNTPLMVCAGATALCKGAAATDSDIEKAKIIFSFAGTAVIVEEQYINAITALSGSGPAYVFYLCELMAQAAANLGLDKTTALELAKQTIFGAGKMLATSPDAPEILRQKVTSPNGTTEAAIKSFQNSGLGAIVNSALLKAAERAKELAN